MPVVCFAELVWTSLWAVLAEHHVPYTQFLPRLARKKSNVPKLKSWSKIVMYILCIKVPMWLGKGWQVGDMWHIQSIGKRKYLPQSNVKRIAHVGPINSLLLLIGIHIPTHLLIRKSKTMNQSKNQSESLEPGQSKIQAFWLLLIIFDY